MKVFMSHAYVQCTGCTTCAVQLHSVTVCILLPFYSAREGVLWIIILCDNNTSNLFLLIRPKNREFCAAVNISAFSKSAKNDMCTLEIVPTLYHHKKANDSKISTFFSILTIFSFPLTRGYCTLPPEATGGC